MKRTNSTYVLWVIAISAAALMYAAINKPGKDEMKKNYIKYYQPPFPDTTESIKNPDTVNVSAKKVKKRRNNVDYPKVKTSIYQEDKKPVKVEKSEAVEVEKLKYGSGCGTHNGNVLYKGARGGCYYIGSTGKKIYVSRSECKC